MTRLEGQLYITGYVSASDYRRLSGHSSLIPVDHVVTLYNGPDEATLVSGSAISLTLVTLALRGAAITAETQSADGATLTLGGVQPDGSLNHVPR